MKEKGLKKLSAELLKGFKVYCSIDRDTKTHTIQQHISHLQMFFRYFTEKSASFTPLAFKEFLSDYKDKKDAGTLQGYIFTARVFCDYLIHIGQLDKNWAKDIPMPRRIRKLPDILSVEEIEAILTVPIKYHYAKHRLKWDALFHLLAKTGCRIGEALEARVKHFDLIKGEWRIEGQKFEGTKTKIQRLVPLAPDLVQKIKELAQNKKPEDYLFTSDKAEKIGRVGKHLDASSVRGQLRLRAKKAGITKRVTPHIFRHSFITELLRQDISILKVAMLCGHEEVGTTQRYAKLVMEDLRSAIYRHPLVAKMRNPYDILEHVKETIKSFRLDQDKRFHYELSEGNEGIRLSLFIR